MFGNSFNFPLSTKNLKRLAGGSPERDFLKMLASRNIALEKHDFNRSLTADVTNTWSVGASSTATTWAVLAEPGGWLRGVTGASVATGGLQLYGANKFWNGTRGAGIAALIRLSAVTEIRAEIGFADVAPAAATNLVNLPSAAFNSAVSAAVYLYDHTGSTTTSGLYTIGTSNAYGAVATTTNRFSSAAVLFVALEINGTGVQLWLGDGARAITGAVSAFTAANGVVPFLGFTTSSGSKNVDIDTIWTWTLDRQG